MGKFKILESYKSIALISSNTFIFLFFVNVILFFIFAASDHIAIRNESNPVVNTYGENTLKKVYPHINNEDIKELLNENWNREFIFESFTLFKESPYKGRYTNVDDNGFRITRNQGPWPPNTESYNIFLFGGSTTFGYGLPDDQTLASYLQDFLSGRIKRKISVYNFGRGYYISVQERILFEKFLIAGVIPDMVIFIDGLNDFIFFEGEPWASERFEGYMRKHEGKNRKSLAKELLNKLPMTRVGKAINSQIKSMFKQDDNSGATPQKNIALYGKENNKESRNDYTNKSIIASVINRYVQNKKIIEAIAEDYGIHSVFVWQPVPMFKYDLENHLFADSKLATNNYVRYGYQYMERSKNDLGTNFLWLADIQENLQKPLYVDALHYSSEMSELLAFNIGILLFDRNLLVGAQ